MRSTQVQTAEIQHLISRSFIWKLRSIVRYDAALVSSREGLNRPRGLNMIKLSIMSDEKFRVSQYK